MFVRCTTGVSHYIIIFEMSSADHINININTIHVPIHRVMNLIIPIDYNVVHCHNRGTRLFSIVFFTRSNIER